VLYSTEFQGPTLNSLRDEALTPTTRLREEVETILTSEVRLALDRFRSATSALLEEAAAGPVRLEQAQQAKASAAGELKRALRRHSRFILHREIPREVVPELIKELLDRPGRSKADASD
jgi:hypothetical protein